MANKNKDLQILAYLAQKHPKASVTVLMKLCYLIDLVSFKRNKEQITGFEYKRYNFGPFDEDIYIRLKELTEKNIISQKQDYTQTGNEYIIYCFNEESDFSFDEISEPEIGIMNEVLDSVNGYGAKALTDIAYKTRPMQALGATLNGGEHLNEKLDLSL